MKKISATSVSDETGKQYHLGVKPGDLAENILLVGDPNRVSSVTEKFDSVRFRTQHREFITATGLYKGVEISVIGTGIGHDNTEITMVEACQVTKNPTFIRGGSCGALQKEMNLADLIISKGAVRLDGTTHYFVHDGYPAVADPEVTMALAGSAANSKAPFHLGITASAPSFYGAQGREVSGFPPRFPELPAEMARQGVANFEMETSALFVLATLRGVRAGAVCTVFASRPRDEFADADLRSKGEQRCIEVALNAFLILKKMDVEKTKNKQPIWTPTNL